MPQVAKSMLCGTQFILGKKTIHLSVRKSYLGDAQYTCRHAIYIFEMYNTLIGTQIIFVKRTMHLRIRKLHCIMCKAC